MPEMKKMGVSGRGYLVIGLVLFVAIAAVAIGSGWFKQAETLTNTTPPSPGLTPTSKETKQVETSASPTPKPVSPTPTPNLEQAVSLGEALAQGWVSAEIRGPSTSLGDKFILTVGRPVTHEMAITIPTGSLLLNTIPTEPDMVVRRLQGFLGADGQVQSTSVIQMLDDEWHEYILEAYSLDFHKDQVRPNATFVWSDPPPSDTPQPVVAEVLQVLKAIDNLPETSPEAIQAAIWAITDGVNQEELKGKGYTLDLEAARAIFEAAGLDPGHKRLFSQDQPKTAKDYFIRGETYDQMSEYAQALADYTEAIKLKKDYVEALYRRGVILKEQQDYGQAIADLTEVTRLDPQHHDSYFALGMAYYSIPNPDYGQVITNMTKVISLDKNFVEAYHTRGQAYAAKQDFKEAILDFTEVISRDKTYTDAYFNRGLAYTAIPDIENAIIDFTEVISRDNEFIEAYYARGQAYYYQQKFTEAIANFSIVTHERPEFAEAFRSRGRSYYYKKEYTPAIQDFKQYLELNKQAIDRQEIAELIANLETISSTPQPAAIALVDAVEQNLIQAQIFGFGTASGDSMIVGVKRLITQELEIMIPSGTILGSTRSSESDMVVRRLRGLALSGAEVQPATVIHLTDDKPKTYFLEAYSLNFHKTTPSTTTLFFLGEAAKPEILRVLEAANQLFEGGGDIVAIQAAIWAIMDDVTWLDLVRRQYQPDLRVVQTIFQVAGLDLGCKKLFGGAPPCPPVSITTPALTLGGTPSPSAVSTPESTSSDTIELPTQIPTEPSIAIPASPNEEQWILVADSVSDYRKPTQYGGWVYLWSPSAGSIQFEPMVDGGGCYRSPDSTFALEICQDTFLNHSSGGLGVQWKPHQDGTVLLQMKMGFRSYI